MKKNGKGLGYFRDYVGKHQILLHLLLSIFGFLCIPLLLANVYVVNRGIRGIKEREKARYANSVSDFREFFDSQLDRMLECTVEFSVKKPIVANQIRQDSRYLWDAFSILNNYRRGVGSADDLFLYFRSVDYLIGTEYRYDWSYFADRYFGGDEKMRIWLDERVGERENRRIFIRSQQEDGLFIAFTASVQKSADSVILFYITPSSMQEAFWGGYAKAMRPVSDSSFTGRTASSFSSERMRRKRSRSSRNFPASRVTCRMMPEPSPSGGRNGIFFGNRTRRTGCPLLWRFRARRCCGLCG